MQQKNSHANATNSKLQTEAVAKAILDLIRNEGAKESIGWDWDRLAVDYVTDTHFDRLHQPGAVYLSRVIKHPDFLKMLSSRGISTSVVFHVDENARLYYTFNNISSSGFAASADSVSNTYFYRTDITSHVTGLADFANDLRLMASIAKTTGGFVTSGKKIAVGQWLRFHGLPAPTGEADTKELIDLINVAFLPEPLPYGNFWQLLDAPEDSPYKLTPPLRETIRNITTNRFTGNETPLAEFFGDAVRLVSGSADKLPTSVGYRLDTLITSAILSADQYLEALEWFGAEADPKPTRAFLEQLMIAVMLIDLDPEVDIASTRFAGFDLYSANHLLRRPAEVRRDLEHHLQHNAGISDIIAPLIAELVLGGMAPEYLVPELPVELKLATPGWVVFSQAVQFVENLAPGSSRNMSYQHVLGFSRLAEVAPELRAVHEQNAFDPVVTWALMNNLIAREVDGSLSQQAMAQAVSEYQRYIDQIVGAANKLGKPLPHRRLIALQALKTEVPECDPEELLVKHRGSGGGAGRKVSVLDLYMGDELHTQDWDRVRGTSIYTSFPGLTYLYPVPDLFKEATHNHFNGMRDAVAANINIALSQLESKDRTFIENGHLAIYSVQHYIPESSQPSPRPGVNSTISAHAGETYRFGLVICAKSNSTVRCYELFPLRAQCTFNERLTTVLKPLVMPDDGGYVKKTSLLAPLDLQAYSKNNAPRNDRRGDIFIHRIGEFKESAEDTDDARTPNRYFRSSRKEAIGELIAKEVPLITEDELMALGLDQTGREKAIEKTDAIFNSILNIIIPFKECIEELASGDASRQAKAVPGCMLDALSVAVAFAAVPSRIAATATKASTFGSKLLSASRVLGSTVVSLFNPLDGLGDLLKGGGKLIGREVKRLGTHLASASHLAGKQFSRLAGTRSYDLVKAVNHASQATKIRNTLDAVSHARAVLKIDDIADVEQLLAHLHANSPRLLGNLPGPDALQLLEKSLTGTNLITNTVDLFKTILDQETVEDLVSRQAKLYSLSDLRQHKDPLALPKIFNDALLVEYRNRLAG